MKKRLLPTEFQEQAAFVEYLEIKQLELDFRFFAVPNGTYTNSWTAKRKAKREGVKRGVTDVIILYNNGKHNILFIEMKRQKGGKLSEEQEDWQEWLDQHDYAVCRADGNKHAQLLFEKFINADY